MPDRETDLCGKITTFLPGNCSLRCSRLGHGPGQTLDRCAVSPSPCRCPGGRGGYAGQQWSVPVFAVPEEKLFSFLDGIGRRAPDQRPFVVEASNQQHTFGDSTHVHDPLVAVVVDGEQVARDVFSHERYRLDTG
jgi:hypothetical protein